MEQNSSGETLVVGVAILFIFFCCCGGLPRWTQDELDREYEWQQMRDR